MVTQQDTGLAPDITYATGYFDGAATTNIGGAGFVLLINSSHYFHAKMGCSNGKNNRDELLALWALFSFKVSTRIPSLSVFRDSKVIIN